MPTPAVNLRLRRFRRRFGIAAPKVVVRSQFSWRWLALSALLSVFLVGSIGGYIAQSAEDGAFLQEVQGLRKQILAQREELTILRSAAGTGQNAVNIERASQQQLLARIQGLEAQNAALKEDMLLFERLVPMAGDGPVVRIEGFRVVQKAPRRFSYRMLLAFQPDRLTPDFRGRLQLLVSFAQSGKHMQFVLPNKRDTSAEYQIEIQRFLRREGEFELPESASLLGVEARILQGDTLKSKLSAQL
ncbi:MAG: hypothetical protein HGA71_19065 [Azonexaceae bacterium]|nr:hypothetical protein [Azonexaceae bacterium]